MRILVYPHDLAVGGSQLNALDLAAAVRDRGHEVLVHGAPGPLVERVRDLGLEFVPSAPVGRRPTPAVVGSLRALVRERGIDVLHGYEWPPGLECHLAARGTWAVPVTTVLSMAVAPFLPRSSHLVVGTEQIAAHERAAGRRRTWVIEPAVDLAHDGPDVALDLAGFRRRWGLGDRPTVPTVVCVTRLARQLKREGLLATLDAVAEVARRTPVRLLLVGDGECRAELAARADAINSEHPGTVVMTGELADPRPAYAVADVALGMGGSALRAMAYGVPLVVLGEGGYVEPLTEESLPGFRWRGWFGHGGDDPAARLAAHLRWLLADPARCRAAGALARRTVEEGFALTDAARRQERVYEAARADRAAPAESTAAAARSVLGFGTHHVVRRTRRLVGSPAADDFNARPVARADDPASARPVGVALWFAGASWDAVAGTDRQLVTALARHRPVVWVDPPMSGHARRRRGVDVPPVSEPWPGVVRVSTTVPPGVSRPLSRSLAHALVSRHAAGVVRAHGHRVDAVVVTSPEHALPRRSPGVRLYFETDDFVAGAGLLGTARAHALRRRRRNVGRSDVVLAVTEDLARRVAGLGVPWRVLPNGTDADHFRSVGTTPAAVEVTLCPPVAGLVGQLNDRLDLDALDAVARTGSRLLLVGPRHETRPETRRRLDTLIARPNVQWVDRQPFDRLPAFLSAVDVGLTPYAVTEFNRGSHPLKTLEYLAAGRHVVSTDLPASRALGSDLVTVARTPEEFAAATVRHLGAGADAHDGADDGADEKAAAGRREFARSHSWEARAAQLEEICREVRREPVRRNGRRRRDVP